MKEREKAVKADNYSRSVKALLRSKLKRTDISRENLSVNFQKLNKLTILGIKPLFKSYKLSSF